MAAAATALAALAAAAPAAAQEPGPFTPYGGKSPYRCEIQDAGTGATVAQPDADPYCVEFDKTEQNVTELGMVEFLADEPARVAAAGPKCFYFQRDHWTSWVQQDTPPAIYTWDGNYFFDKARSVGGVNVASFELGGAPMDARPYAPPEYADYFEEGGGGNLFIHGGYEADPNCVARVDTAAERKDIYRRWYRRALRS